MGLSTDQLISVEAFLTFAWVAVALSSVCFFTRAYIRYVCFDRLLVEDWLVAVALAIYIVSAVLWQLHARDMYNMAHAVEGTYVPGPTFLDDTQTAIRATGVMSILVYVGLWLIKASFLALFYRLGRQIPLYMRAWWICSALIMACGLAGVGLNQYQCMFGNIDVVIATCMQPASLHDIFIKEITASVLDIVSDLLIIVFPIWILWRTRVSLRQKLVFSAIFCLVGLTVSVAIVRGAFASVIQDSPTYALQQINISWPFWFFVEYFTSFLVACAISFRSLFVQHREKRSVNAEANQRRNIPSTSMGNNGGRARYYFHKLHDTLLATARHLEGTAYDHEVWKLPMPTSGRMTVDFSHDDGWRRVADDGESLRALKPRSGQIQTIVSAV